MILNATGRVPVKSVNGYTGDVSVANRNLLDNPWFQINQRGATTLSSSGYFVDRWLSSNAHGRFSISNGILTLATDGNIAYFRQKFENNLEIGKTFTISAIVKGGFSGYIGIVDPSYEYVTGTEYHSTYSNWTLISHTFTVTEDNCAMATIRLDVGASFQVKAMKLEVGSVSTLSMDVAPNYELELAKCQRFYERISAGTSNFSLGMGMAFDAADITVPIQIKPKRTTPTIGGTGNLRAGTTVYNISAFTSIIFISANLSNETGLYTLQMTKNAAFSAGQVYRVGIVANGYIDFSADL